MKKATLFLLILPALLLAACGNTKATTNTTAGAGDPNARTLPPVMQVAIGTFKLEGTPQAVSAKQAAELLPLWQVYESLSQSDTAAQAEIDGLVGQIEQSMTKDQMHAIQGMNLTPQDLFAVMREQGIELGGGPQAAGTRVPNSGQNRRQEFGPGGGFVGPPDGGGFSGGPGEFNRSSGTRTPSQNGSNQPRAAINRIPTPLLNALIDLLKKRAAS